ncbi:MAG: UDP-3-O-acyl-N-acetylglucosamine deacetylase [Syntrophobacteraceae bacterium]
MVCTNPCASGISTAFICSAEGRRLIINTGLLYQGTLRQEVFCDGAGLHSGAKVSMKLKPAPVDYGVRFRRMDIPGRPSLRAYHHNVVDTLLATSIGSNGVVVSTVEHLMAALAGSGVDNIMVEVDGPELPIFDGSAARYVELLREAGVKQQAAHRKYMRVQRPIMVREGEAYIKASPSDSFKVRYAIDFPHPAVGKQEYTWSFSEHGFSREIAKARTFGFLRDVQKLQSMGLALGGSLANVVVMDDYGLLNQGGFRYSDECVRHKILDFIGDLALAGMPVCGNFEVYKAGHGLHHRFLKELTGKPGFHSVSTATNVTIPYLPNPSLPNFTDTFQPLSQPIQS